MPRPYVRPLLHFLFVALALTGSSLGQNGPASAHGPAVSITEKDGKLRVEIGGKLFTEYNYQNVSRPYFYPLLGPDGQAMTRHWPMESPENEDHDHPHHRSLWYAHGSINGQDFWSEEKNAGKTVHEGFIETKSGDIGLIRSRNKLVAKDGTVVCTDERVMRIYNHTRDRLFDFEITIHASNGAITLGDTKEGSMAIRLAETMRLKQPKAKEGLGHIINSEGVRDGDTWGKRANWVDYYGPVDGKIMGVAVFDNPANPRHPTWWHVRDYGLFAANPFGLHDFEKKPVDAGNMTVPAGQSITFRYRFYIHTGNEIEASVASHYAEYAGEGK